MAEKTDHILCPSCNAEIAKEDLGVLLFNKATVISCPVCNKAISLKPSEF